MFQKDTHQLHLFLVEETLETSKIHFGIVPELASELGVGDVGFLDNNKTQGRLS